MRALADAIRDRLSRPLPGLDAQLRMAPRPRPGWDPAVLPDGLRDAAGLVLIYPHHDVLQLVRGEPGSVDEVAWDPAAGTIDDAALAGVGAIVNLAGANIGQRWTPERQRRIRDSRVDG